MEGDPGWHGKAPNEAEWRKALTELGHEPTQKSPETLKSLIAAYNQSHPKHATPQIKTSSSHSTADCAPSTAALSASSATSCSQSATLTSLSSPSPSESVGQSQLAIVYPIESDGKAEQGPATREAYGKTLAAMAAENPDLIVLDADLSKSTMTADFRSVAPQRFFNAGIAEANMACMAGGLAAAGKTVFISSFAVFAVGRAYEQILNTIASSGFNVKIAATHAGLSVGEDGMSHQMLSDIALMRAVPGMKVLAPADAAEAASLIRYAAASQGPAYIRLGRAKAPVIFAAAAPAASAPAASAPAASAPAASAPAASAPAASAPAAAAPAAAAPATAAQSADACTSTCTSTCSATDASAANSNASTCTSTNNVALPPPLRIRQLRPGSDVTLAACGIMVAVALEAAAALAATHGINARVLNVSCIKPLDTAAIAAAARETGAIVTCEEHSVIGGLGAAIAEAVAETHPVPVLRVGVQDSFGQSGQPADLLKLYGLDKDHVIAKAKEAVSRKQRS